MNDLSPLIDDFQAKGAVVVRNLLSPAELDLLRTGVEAYRRLVETSRAAETAGRLMGARQAGFHHDHLLVKEPGTRQPTPWHQDQPYCNIDGTQTCNLWIPPWTRSRPRPPCASSPAPTKAPG